MVPWILASSGEWETMNETHPQDANGIRDHIAQLWQAAAQIDRAEFFGLVEDADRWMPIVHPDDARTAWPGYLGAEYRPGQDPLLLAINPGGGGVKSDRLEQVEADRPLYQALRAFRDAPPRERRAAFERSNHAAANVMLTWSIGKLYQAVIEKTGWTLNHVAVMNLVPYRTRSQDLPQKARNAGWHVLVEPSLKELAPVVIFALGRPPWEAVEKWGDRRWETRYLKRSRGDRCVTLDALKEIGKYVREKDGAPPLRPRLVGSRLGRASSAREKT